MVQRWSLALSLCVLVALAVVVAQQKPGNIQGVWRVAEATFTGPNARTVKSPQPGIRIFTQRHYSINDVTTEKPRAEHPPQGQATDKELADAFGPYTGQAGTYELKGAEITLRVVSAKSPNAMRSGNFTTLTFRFDGEALVLTGKANAAGPIANPTTLRLTRIE
jgi:hypothetical protein